MRTVDKSYRIPSEVWWVGKALHITQKWSMFSPKPTTSYGWFVVDGTLKNDKKWDVYSNQEVSFERPEDIRYQFDSYRVREIHVEAQIQEE